MDTPAHIRDYQDLLRDTELLNNMSLSMDSNGGQSAMHPSFLDALAEIQSRLDRLRASAILSSIPQLVQATPEDHPGQPHSRTLPPNSQEESPMQPPDQVSPAVSPQPDSNNRQTEMGPSFLDTLAETQLLLDYIRATALLRATLQLARGTPQVRAPLQPLMLNNREDSSGPVVSPDEIVIQQRGRRRLPVTWSPDMDLKSFSSRSADRTPPPKIAPGHLSSQKVEAKLSSTARKRLRFVPLSPEKIDLSDLSTPEKFKITTPGNGLPPTKRPKMGKL